MCKQIALPLCIFHQGFLNNSKEMYTVVTKHEARKSTERINLGDINRCIP